MVLDWFVLGMLLILLGLALSLVFLKRARKAKELEEEARPERKDLVTLEHHIRRLEHGGHSRTTILKKLAAVGWEEHLVELVLDRLHQPHNRLHALEKYVQQQLLKAKPKELIKEALLSAGWDEEIVDAALGLAPHHEGKAWPEKEEAEAAMAVLFNFLN